MQCAHPTYYFEVHRCVKSRLQEHPSPPIVSPPLLLSKTASQFLSSALITRQLECKKLVALCPFLVFLLLHNFLSLSKCSESGFLLFFPTPAPQLHPHCLERDACRVWAAPHALRGLESWWSGELLCNCDSPASSTAPPVRPP